MYVQSFEAYTFYSNLKEFSQNESVLSQVQPGFFEGNIVSTTNSNEKIIGLFDLSSIDTKRIYFNYSDLYPNESLPPYAISCNTKAPSELPILPLPCPILLACYLASGEWKYVDENNDYDPINPDKGFFLLAPRSCGDCTVYGNSTPPTWWED